ncbi:winged helix-turn-helix domain-containing protein [Devosia sp. SL43]|uniref:winged helix-turn-helix domain-containing protein n=1 Tax=Devosia sp. SL43 TaxID=2806348 RepID=UPI001F40B32D|nr:helix-turn-helix domain-containing protein [Devosia sp. SL43]UJW85587.1 helix-turn-helix transcriptional regulator [Devosia sp. SL43]
MTTPRSISRIVPDTEALKALTHPVRVRMLGLLRMEGPATATALAARLGLNSGDTSYHLRQLARHGFIEEDEGRGTRRDRWWKARHETTSVDTAHAQGAALEAGLAFTQAALSGQVAQMQRAVEGYSQLSPDWRAASDMSDFTMPLTADAARALTERIGALLWEAMAAAPKLGDPLPEGVRPFTVMLHSFPMQDPSK